MEYICIYGGPVDVYYINFEWIYLSDVEDWCMSTYFKNCDGQEN